MVPRPATIADLQQILRIEARFSVRRRQRIDEYAAMGCDCLVVGAPAQGALWYRFVGNRLELISLAVLKDGKGFGRLLIESALNLGRAMGHEKAILDVIETNTRAKHLYECFGFRVVGGNGYGALRMHADL